MSDYQLSYVSVWSPLSRFDASTLSVKNPMDDGVWSRCARFAWNRGKRKTAQPIEPYKVSLFRPRVYNVLVEYPASLFFEEVVFPRVLLVQKSPSALCCCCGVHTSPVSLGFPCTISTDSLQIPKTTTTTTFDIGMAFDQSGTIRPASIAGVRIIEACLIRFNVHVAMLLIPNPPDRRGTREE